MAESDFLSRNDFITENKVIQQSAMYHYEEFKETDDPKQREVAA